MYFVVEFKDSVCSILPSSVHFGSSDEVEGQKADSVYVAPSTRTDPSSYLLHISTS